MMSMLGNMQSIDRYRSARSPRRAGLLVDDDADAARQRDGQIWVGGKDRLSCYGKSHQLGIPAGAGLSIAATGARVRFHDRGGNQAIQKVRSWSVDCDWLLLPLPDFELLAC
jgi:hypothetical protein